MPAQCMIRKLTRDQLTAEIAKTKGGELVEVIDYRGALLVRAKDIEGATPPKAAEVIQSIADADGALVLEDYKAGKAAEAAEKAAKAVTPAKA